MVSHQSKPLLVVGHKNPDTDSICSAIAYAHLKSELLGQPSVPYRAGSLNPQTAFVLDRFGAHEPDLLQDVFPKIFDIMVPEESLIVLGPDDPLATAQKVMVEHHFTFLPVVDAARKLIGKISALRLAGLADEVATLAARGRITVNLPAFLGSVDGQHRCGPQPPATFEGRLAAIGLGGDGERIGDRPDGAAGVMALVPRDEVLIKDAVARPGVEIVVVCGRGGISDDVAKEARASGVCVVETPADVLGAAVRATLSVPVKELMEKDFPTFRCDDRVRDVQREIVQYHDGGFLIVDEEETLRGVITRSSFINKRRSRVVLVDHNEFAQAVDGVDEAEIVEIIDHHRLGNCNTDTPITFINKVVGSTSTIIAEMYRVLKYDPGPMLAGLMLSAILSDTVVLRSPTTTSVDRKIAEWLAEIAGVDIEAYGGEMFSAGSSLAGVSSDDIIRRDRKVYSEMDWTFSVSQVETVGIQFFKDRQSEIEEALRRSVREDGHDFGCLMVTDITRETSVLLCVGDKRVLDVITYPRIDKHAFEMRGVLSRKKQALPYFLDRLRVLGG